MNLSKGFMSVYRIFFINLQVINILGTNKDFIFQPSEKKLNKKKFSIFKLFFIKRPHKEFGERKVTSRQLCVPFT